MKDYTCVVVGTTCGNEVLFAKISNSKTETMAVLGSEIVRLLHDYDGTITVEQGKDRHGEPIISVKYDYGKHIIEYNFCFVDKDDKEEEDEE